LGDAGLIKVLADHHQLNSSISIRFLPHGLNLADDLGSSLVIGIGPFFTGKRGSPGPGRLQRKDISGLGPLGRDIVAAGQPNQSFGAND